MQNTFQKMKCPVKNCTKTSFCSFYHPKFTDSSTQTLSEVVDKTTQVDFNETARLQSTNLVLENTHLLPENTEKSRKRKHLPPKIAADLLNSRFSKASRQDALDRFYHEFSRIYTNLSPEISAEHAVRQELKLYEMAKSADSYKILVFGTLRRLKSRPLANDYLDVGIDKEWSPKQKSEIQLSEKTYLKYLLNEQELVILGYPMHLVEYGPLPKFKAICDRCTSDFDLLSNSICFHHFGRLISRVSEGRCF
jgi:hypothetical protein